MMKERKMNYENKENGIMNTKGKLAVYAMLLLIGISIGGMTAACALDINPLAQMKAYAAEEIEESNRQDEEEEFISEQEEETDDEEERLEPIGEVVIQGLIMNVRDIPNGEILGQIMRGQRLPFYEMLDGWAKIDYNGGYAYVCARYCDRYDIEGNLTEAADLQKSEPEPQPEPAPEPEPAPQPAPEPEPVPQPEPEPQPEPAPAPQLDLNSMSDRELCEWVLAQVTTPDMDAASKIVAVNNFLCDRMEYDLNYYTTRDAIINGRGRCQGYANAFKNIMNTAGIPTDYIGGYVAGYEDSHAWNRVLLGDVYYCVDVTWNDCSNSSRYLLIPEAEFNQDKCIVWINPRSE